MSNEIVKNSINEVNLLFTQQIDYLQAELLASRTEASEKVIALTGQIRGLEEKLIEKDEVLGKFRARIKELKYNNEISLKASQYKLEKSE